MSSTDSQPAPLLRRESLVGLVARVGVYCVVMVAAFAAAWLLNVVAFNGSIAGSSGATTSGLPNKILAAMWLIVLIPIGLSVVCSELPRGSDWVMVRLGIATFCRTGLPLLIVIFVDKLNGERLSESAFGFLAFFYLVGFITSVWVSVGRLRSAGSLNEVDSAVV